MAIGIQNYTNIITPNGDYPDGRIKNDSGVGDGTPVSQNVYSDIHEFFAKLLRFAGKTPNGMPENETNGHQYFDSLRFATTGHWATCPTDPSYDTIEPLQVLGEKDGVRMRGIIEYNNASGTTVANGIPLDLRPLSNKIIFIDVFDSGTGGFLKRARATILGSGVIFFDDDSGLTGTDLLFFNGCYYGLNV